MAQSPELAGGAGFKFEDEVSGTYVAAMLTRTSAAGTGDRQVTRVALQQRDFGEPLDDLIVDCQGLDGSPARLSLQVKSTLTISEAKTNTDFRDVVRDSLATLRKTDFRDGEDRYGVVAGALAAKASRTINQLIGFARNSVETSHFLERFGPNGNASQPVLEMRDMIRRLADGFSAAPLSDAEFHRFLSHFVVIEFDFRSAGSKDRAAGVTRVGQALADHAVDQAALVWSRLCQAAGLAATAAGVFDRPRLLRELKPVAPLKALASLRPDLARLGDLARAWVSDIEKDVGGVTLDRASLREDLTRKLAAGRLVQLSGLPGSGKSVLLRMELEAALERGPILFLKHDRILGNSWASFATANGLSSAPLETLLAEVGAVGSPTLFIDGVDRIENAHRGVVVDIVRTLIRVDGLQDWRVVMTLRDSGIGPLRNWLGEALTALGVQTLDVPQLDAAEAVELAATLPALETVLTSTGPVGEIARRPFFAKILQRAAMVDGGGTEVRSEVDLIRNWWLAGGYAADGKDALLRQRAILDLGRRRARGLSRPIAVSQLSPTTIEQIQDLVDDGILQFVTPGISLRFAHDIFFEWAFFQALSDRGDDWPEELVEAGQAPAFARVVELFSQSSFPSATWGATLSTLSRLKIRSQWVRAWLLGPVASPGFPADSATYGTVLFADDCRWLYKALVWFQAERTMPNPGVIGGDLPAETRIRMADAFGWPSDFETWARLIWFLLARLDRIPQRLRPQVTAVFAVWQNMLAEMKNPVSDAILAAVQPWLLAIADDSGDSGDSVARWRRREDGASERAAYVALIFRAARVYPDPTTAYLTALLAAEDVDDPVFEEVITFAPILAQTHAALLVAVTLKHLKEELPADKEARERQERARSAERRRAVLTIPEDQRTRDQHLEASGAFMSIGSRSVSSHDWNSLALDRNMRNFFPASPLRQPYPALFDHAPDEAIRLVADLSNHAMEAWRQLHTLDHDTPGTPIPLVLEFPWGRQTFWGGDREYLWARGMWGPKPLASGYLALEDWALGQLAEGADVDVLIRRIVSDNSCVAVLGVAVALALESEVRSATIATLVGSQRLWGADETRFRKDVVESRASLIGFKGARDRAHIEAVERGLSRPIRRKRLQDLGQLYVFAGGVWAEPAKAAILAFPNDLPFLYEEHRTNNEAVDHYAAEADRFAEVADLDTYTVQATEDPDMVAVFHTPPSLNSEEAAAARTRAATTLMESSLWGWALEAFETGSLGERFTRDAAVKAARDLDGPDLFLDSETADELIGVRRGAVAAVAAIALRHRTDASEANLEWARAVTLRALETGERQDALWNAGMIVPWHQTIFAARAIASDIRAGVADDSLAEALIGLVAHPLQAVAFSAFEEAVALVDVSPALAWAALTLGFDLCDIRPRRTRRGYDDPLHASADLRAAIMRALDAYRAGAFGTPLPPPPPPWLEVAGPDRRPLETLVDPDGQPENGTRWAANPRLWDHHLAGELVKRIPVEALLGTPARDAVLTLVDEMLVWTIQQIAPTWSTDRHRRREDTYEWDPELGELLARVAGELEFDAVKDRILTPISSLQGENAYTLLAPFTDLFVRRYVFDSQSPPAHTMAVLDLCLGRFLQDSVFSRTSYRAGELHGFDQPMLAKALMFVQVEQIANLAARFANGDWSEIDMLLDNVARYVQAAGWSAFVMTQYLTLCERARDHYPPDHFADLVLAVLALGEGEFLPGWHDTTLPARISGLVQTFSERAVPLSADLALKLLQILDLLVDLGDRRSAALQQGDNFREIQLVG